MAETKNQPPATQLYFASLVATAMVYGGGVLIITALVIATGGTEDPMSLIEFILMAISVGTLLAAMAGIGLVAPLGTAFALAVLRLSPPGWWQGPLTGVLVALALVGLTIAVFGAQLYNDDMGNRIVMAIPVVLAFFAGGYVQRRILKWPGGEPASAT